MWKLWVDLAVKMGPDTYMLRKIASKNGEHQPAQLSTQYSQMLVYEERTGNVLQNLFQECGTASWFIAGELEEKKKKRKLGRTHIHINNV